MNDDENSFRSLERMTTTRGVFFPRRRVSKTVLLVFVLGIVVRTGEIWLLLPKNEYTEKQIVAHDNPQYWKDVQPPINRDNGSSKVTTFDTNQNTTAPLKKSSEVTKTIPTTTKIEEPRHEAVVFSNNKRAQLDSVTNSHSHLADEVKNEEIHMLEEVLHLLFPNETMAKDYIRRFPITNLSFYVYDTLPKSYQWISISDCVEQRYRPKGMAAERFQSMYCDFAGVSICNPPNVTEETQYSTRRSNRNMDTVVSKLFSEYSGPLRTEDPHKASMLVVPFPANGLFECLGGRKAAQKKTAIKVLQQDLFQPFLTYFKNDSSTTSLQSKHFFLQTTQGMMHHLAHEVVLATVNTPGGRTLIVPYVNSNSEYQPPALHRLYTNSTAFEEFFGPRQKTISVAAVMSSKIKGNPTIREIFFNSSQELIGNHIAGLPTKLIHVEGRRRMPDEQETMALYRQSLFCPSLRGDSPNQKRFFDAILSGCIPVVITHRFGKSNNETSYFAPNVPLSYYLPYAKGSFFGEPDMGIDYSELVVEIDAKCGIKCIKPALEDLIVKKPNELRRKQLAIVKIGRLLTYGLAENAWRNIDTMIPMILHARHEIFTRLSTRNT